MACAFAGGVAPVSYLFVSSFSKWKLTLTSQVAGILLIQLGVGFVTGCGVLEVVRSDRWGNRIMYDKAQRGV